MMYDISGISREDKVLDIFPHLSYHQPFAAYGSGADDVWLRFIIYYCDEESPFAHLFTEDRLFACVDAAGIPEDDPRLGEVLRWESESIREMVDRLFVTDPTKQLTPNEGLLSMAVEYRRLQFPATFDVLTATKKLHLEVIESTSTPITKENSAEQIRISEALHEKLRIADSLLKEAPAIDAMAAKMRRDERAREARKISREERISKGARTEAPATNIPNSGPTYGNFYGALIGGFTPELLNTLLGNQHLGIYDFESSQPTPAAKSGSWASLFWALKLKGLISWEMSAADGDTLLKNTFGARTSKTRITDVGRDNVDFVSRSPVKGTKVDQIYRKLGESTVQPQKTPSLDK